jgi:hypothetical protein
MNLGKIGDFILKESWVEQQARKSRENSANKISRYEKETSVDKNI